MARITSLLFSFTQAFASKEIFVKCVDVNPGNTNNHLQLPTYETCADFGYWEDNNSHLWKSRHGLKRLKNEMSICPHINLRHSGAKNIIRKKFYSRLFLNQFKGSNIKG